MRKLLLIIIGIPFFSLLTKGQVNLQTGSAEVNIPIYNFTDNLSRLKFNLGVNYSSGSGLLVDEIAGNVGTKWTLSVLPKIVRIQKGLPDDQNMGSNKPQGIIYQPKYSGSKGCPLILNYYPLSSQQGETYSEAKIVSDDKLVDEFQVFLNGRLITFYLRSSLVLTEPEFSVISLNPIDAAIIIPYRDLPPNDNVSCRTSITRFEILDGDGLTYVFSTREYAKVFNYNSPTQWNLPIPRLVIRKESPQQNDSHVVMAWYISKIIDKKNNRQISFTYNSQILEYEHYAGISIGSDNSTNAGAYQGGQFYLAAVNSIYATLQKNKIISPEISGIALPTGERIEFNYDQAERKDLKGGHALHDIVIKNRTLEQRARFRLTHSYFVKNEIKVPANATEEKWSRLCLTSIQKFGKSDAYSNPPYLFNYYTGTNNTEDFVPPPFFKARDPWGFFNGDQSGATLNTSLNEGTSLTEWRLLCTYGQPHYVNQTREILSTRCKQNYASNGLLKSYTTPEGMITGFQYAQNFIQWSSYSDMVGGVHVSDVTIDGGADGRRQLREYSYTLPDGASSLWGVEPPRFVSKSTRHYKSEAIWDTPAMFQELNLSESVSRNSVENAAKFFLQLLPRVLEVYQMAMDPNPYAIVFSMINMFLQSTNSNNFTATEYFFHRAPLNYANPLPAQFKRVVVKESEVVENQKVESGTVEYQFTSDVDFPAILPTLLPGDLNFDPHFFSQSQRTFSWMYGLPKVIRVFKSGGVNPIKETVNTYENKVIYDSQNDIMMASRDCVPVYFDSKIMPAYLDMEQNVVNNFTNVSIQGKLHVDQFKIQGGYPLLRQTVQTHNGGATAQVVNVSLFEYNERAMLNSRKITDSKGREINTKTYYYYDFYQSGIRPDNIFTRLYDNNRANTPVATETWQTDAPGQSAKLIGSEVFEYGAIPNGDDRLVNQYVYESDLPLDKNSIGEFSYMTPPPFARNPNYFKLKNQLSYNQAGARVQVKNPGYNSTEGIIFGYGQQYPVAKFSNAEFNEVAYTSFETDEKSNWEYDLSRIVGSSTSVTGGKCFQLDWDYYNAVRLSPGFASLITRPYILSFWASSPYIMVGGSMISPAETTAVNGWYFFKLPFTSAAAIVIQGSALIDELRCYPQDARMETFAYDNDGNQTVVCDANNIAHYFEYDGLGRLILVRDQEQNILEKRCYTPQGQPQKCECVGLNLSPDWQNTTTLLRCKKTPGHKNTGEQEREQRDMNPCSETYNQTRWIVVGTNLSACPLPPACDYTTCYGEDRKCVNGLCERGIMIFTNSYNVGSRSYCDYHYEWSDGSWSPSFTLQVPYGASCLINIPADL